MKKAFKHSQKLGYKFSYVVYKASNNRTVLESRQCDKPEFSMLIDPKKFVFIFGVDKPHPVLEFVKKGESIEKNSVFISHEQFPGAKVDDVLQLIRKNIASNIEREEAIDSKTLVIYSKPFVHNQQGTQKIAKWIVTQGSNDVYYLYIELNSPPASEKKSRQHLENLSKEILSAAK